MLLPCQEEIFIVLKKGLEKPEVKNNLEKASILYFLRRNIASSGSKNHCRIENVFFTLPNWRLND